VFGERSAELADFDTINMQVLDRQRVFLERLENFPLKILPGTSNKDRR